MGYILGKDRDQMTLLPESLNDYVNENNPVRVIDAFVESVDLAEAGFRNTTPAKEGRPSYSPRLLLNCIYTDTSTKYAHQENL